MPLIRPRFKLDWFLTGMLVAVVLAFVFPGPGARRGFLHPELLTKVGVVLIFFFNGLALSFDSLKSGALNWKLHLMVQTTSFLLFPLLGLALYLGLAFHGAAASLALGIFFLCALPSTVSSSVALTSAARGNVSGAVFNAALSNLLGVLLTPLWVGAVIHLQGQSVPFGEVILDLFLWLVCPLILGHLLRPWLGGWIARNKKLVYLIDRGTILLLIYTSFCDSVQMKIWAAQSWTLLLATVVICVLLFGAIYSLARFFAARLQLNREDRIAGIFCGSKKSLATGIPMAQLIFLHDPALGLILLPLLVYHPLQLMICSALASRWATEASRSTVLP